MGDDSKLSINDLATPADCCDGIRCDRDSLTQAKEGGRSGVNEGRQHVLGGGVGRQKAGNRVRGVW